jgi:hypothetical protein
MAASLLPVAASSLSGQSEANTDSDLSIILQYWLPRMQSHNIGVGNVQRQLLEGNVALLAANSTCHFRCSVNLALTTQAITSSQQRLGPNYESTL